MSRFGVLHTIVASGDILSGVIEVQGAKSIALLASISVSCQAYLKGGFSTSSVDARRISKTDGSSDWAWNVGSGMKAVDIKEVAGSFPFLRLETSVAQNVASLAVVCKY